MRGAPGDAGGRPGARAARRAAHTRDRGAGGCGGAGRRRARSRPSSARIQGRGLWPEAPPGRPRWWGSGEGGPNGLGLQDRAHVPGRGPRRPAGGALRPAPPPAPRGSPCAPREPADRGAAPRRRPTVGRGRPLGPPGAAPRAQGELARVRPGRKFVSSRRGFPGPSGSRLRAEAEAGCPRRFAASLPGPRGPGAGSAPLAGRFQRWS